MTTSRLASTERKHTDLEWLPSVPAHWTRARLGWVADMVSGGTPSKAERSYWDGDIPWVSPKDMKRPEIADSIDHVTEGGLHETGLKLIEPPAILIVVRGMILAHSFPVARILSPVTINQDMKALKFRADIDDRFAVYLLQGIRDVILAEVEQAAHGTCRLTSERWKKLEAYVPPIEEQRAIADFLDRKTAKIDRLIEQKQRLLELLDEKRTALITQAVTKGLDPDVEMKDSGVEWLGEIPAHWVVKKVRWVFSIGSGMTPPSDNGNYYGGGIPWVTTSELRESVVVSTGKTVAPRALEELSGLQLHATGSVVVAMYGATIGRLAVLGVPATVNQACCVFSDPKGVEMKFWFYWLQMRRKHLISLGYGGGQPNLSQELLRSLQVPLPPLDEQNRIAMWLDAETRKIDSLGEDITRGVQLLHEFRASVVSAAVTGKVDTQEEVGLAR